MVEGRKEGNGGEEDDQKRKTLLVEELVPCLENGFGMRGGIRKGEAKKVAKWNFPLHHCLASNLTFFCTASIRALTDEMGMLKLKANEN